MRKYFLLVAMAVSLCGFKRATNGVNEKVVKAANDKLYSFLENIPVGSESQFGIDNRDEIKTATLGTPYHVMVLTKEFYNAINLSGAAYAAYVTGSNEWRVPVLVNGSSRVLVTVNAENGSYTAGDLGGAGLARELQQGKPRKKHTYAILRVHRLTSDFLIDMPGNSLADAVCIPLASARMALPALSGNEQGYTLAETLNAIKDKLNK